MFACALLNSQPMGFYAPAQIVRDAQDHGVHVLPADVNHSEWDCTLEASPGSGLALRLGLREVGGLAEAAGRRLADKRGDGYSSPQSLWRRAGLDTKALEALARADAFGSMGLARREALWAVKALTAAPPPLLAGLDGAEPPVALPKASAGEEVVYDYASLKLSLKAHPMALLRPQLTAMRIAPSERLAQAQGRVSVAGLVLMRQRPGTASGVIFVTLEDETGIANVVIWPQVFERFRQMVLTSSCLRVDGRVQREGRVIHVIADRLTDLTAPLCSLGDSEMRLRSRDFH